MIPSVRTSLQSASALRAHLEGKCVFLAFPLAGLRLPGAVLDRPVFDKTNLPGRFDLLLKSMPDESQFSGRMKVSETENSEPDLFTAIPANWA
jgi:uncharacterized protein (TIGR03435 family)